MSARRTWMARLGVLLGCAAALVACGGGASTAGAASAGASTAGVAGGAAGSGARSGSRSVRSAPAREADWPTFDFNAQRTGVGPAATGIGRGNLHDLGLRIIHINGTVDASAIELHGLRIHGRRRDVIFVTTTYGHTIAIDPGTGTRLWEFTPRDIRSYQDSPQVTTATPVADPDRRWIYAASPNGFVQKLSATTGREARGWPVRVTFDPTHEKLAGALNLDGPYLVVVTGGYIGDIPPYQGHLVLIDRATGRIAHVFNTLCSDRHGLIDPPSSCPESDSAIWGREGSVIEPGSGRILIATGNGEAGQRSFDGRTDWGDSVLELSSTAQLLHNWTPTDQQRLNDTDTDLGSTEPALVFTGGRRLAVQGGKDGQMHLLDLDRLDGTTGPAGPRTGGELEDVSSPGGGEVLTAPAVWQHGGRAYLFVADDSGTTAYLVHGGHHPSLTTAWRNGTPGTSPVLAGGLLYIYDEVDGTLDVYAPASGIRLAGLGTAQGHWNSPIVVGGRIILPVGSYHSESSTGEIYIWHLPGR